MSVRMALHLQQHQTILRNLKEHSWYSIFRISGKEERTMEGVVIRSTDNHGEYIVGCRMPEDSPAIQKYVNDNYKE